jgi:hypothetical protein
VIEWDPQTPFTYGTPLDTANHLNATADTVGRMYYDPPENTTLTAGWQTLKVAFVPRDTDTYQTVTERRRVFVEPAALLIAAYDTERDSGEPNPVFGGIVDELKPVDQGKVAVAFVSTADETTPPGTYAIEPVVADPFNRLLNYTVRVRAGTLTIRPASAGAARPGAAPSAPVRAVPASTDDRSASALSEGEIAKLRRVLDTSENLVRALEKDESSVNDWSTSIARLLDLEWHAPGPDGRPLHDAVAAAPLALIAFEALLAAAPDGAKVPRLKIQKRTELNICERIYVAMRGFQVNEV